MSTDYSFTDTHIHLDIIQDSTSLLPKLRDEGIRRFIVPDIDFNLCDWLCPEQDVFCCWGCHPAYVPSSWREPKEPVAVGECGLEPADSAEEEKLQEILLEQQIEKAKVSCLPLLLHSIRRDDRILHMLKSCSYSGTGIIHGFCGNHQMAKRWLDAGFYLGIGTLILKKNANRLKEALIYAGGEHMVLETDAPVFHNSRPSDLLSVAERCQEYLRLSREEFSSVTENNVSKIFKKTVK